MVIKLKSLLVFAIDISQWALVPTAVICAQAAMRKAWGRSFLFVDFSLCLLVITAIVLIPLGLLGMTPLDRYQGSYAYAALIGGLLSVPVTRFVRRRFGVNAGA